MSSSEGVETYARALFSLASLTDSVDAADEALSSIVAALRETLSDASVSAEARRAVVH